MGASLGGFGGNDDDGEPGYKPLAEINITPMVDVMLVLLIIFMVAAPLLVAGVPVELPKTTAARLGQSKKPMIVTLAADGRLQIRDEFVARENLIARLTQVRAAEGDAVVYVRADKKIPYGDVMELLGLVGEGGFGRVSLLSQSVPKVGANTQNTAPPPNSGPAP